MSVLSDAQLQSVSVNKGRVWLSTFIAALGSLQFGYSGSWTNPLLPTIEKTFDWCDGFACHDYHHLLLTAPFFITCTLGCLAVGPMLQKGRRFAIKFGDFFFTLGSLICAFCPVTENPDIPFHLFFIGRLSMGLGVGFATVTSPVWIQENTPLALAGLMGCMTELCIMIGVLLPFVFAQGLPTPTPAPEPVDGYSQVYWRCMTAFCALLSAIRYLLLTFVFTDEPPLPALASLPEATPVGTTPKNLTEGEARVLANLQKVYVGDDALKLLNDRKARLLTDHPSPLVRAQLAGLSPANQVEVAAKAASEEAGGPKRLTLPQLWALKYNRFPIVVGCGLSALQQWSGVQIIGIKSNQIFADAGVPEDQQSLFSGAVISSAVVMIIIVAILTKFLGRKTLLLIGASIQLLSTVPGIIAYWTDVGDDLIAYVFTSLLAYQASFSLAAGPMVWVVINEMFDRESKDIGVALSSAFNWVVAGLTVVLGNFIDNKTYFVYSAVTCFLSIVFVITCVKETGGKAVSPYYENVHKAVNEDGDDDEQTAKKNNLKKALLS